MAGMSCSCKHIIDVVTGTPPVTGTISTYSTEAQTGTTSYRIAARNDFTFIGLVGSYLQNCDFHLLKLYENQLDDKMGSILS